MNKYMNCEYGHPLQLNLMVHARGWEKAAGIRNDRMSSGKSTACSTTKVYCSIEKVFCRNDQLYCRQQKVDCRKVSAESEMVESHEECLLQAVLQPVKYVAAHYCNTLLVENHSTLMDRNYKLCRMH